VFPVYSHPDQCAPVNDLLAERGPLSSEDDGIRELTLVFEEWVGFKSLESRLKLSSKLGTRSKSCHDLSWHVFHFPHPNPLPEGEGVPYSRCTIPSRFGMRDTG
jgi:hypothetical protein